MSTVLDDQRLESLREATRIRIVRAEIKRQVKAGTVDVVALVLDPPADLRSMKVASLLEALPMVGRQKAAAWLRRAGVSPVKSLGGLTPRQRAALSEQLVGRVGDA